MSGSPESSMWQPCAQRRVLILFEAWSCLSVVEQSWLSHPSGRWWGGVGTVETGRAFVSKGIFLGIHLEKSRWFATWEPGEVTS